MHNRYLEKLYGIGVLRVDTMNYNGKAKRGTKGLYSHRDFKKAIVTMNTPFAFPQPPEEAEEKAGEAEKKA